MNGLLYFIDLIKTHPSSSPLAAPGERQRNVVMWMDHRAAEQAARITNTGHRVLSMVGGVMSPEMQPPKLLWLKEVRGEQGHHRSLDVLLLFSVPTGQHVHIQFIIRRHLKDGCS